MARLPAGIQNIPSNILLCHIVTGWAASIAINFSTKAYIVIPMDIWYPTNTACQHQYCRNTEYPMHVLYLFLSLSACNDNECWCNLAIPDNILTGLTWLITTQSGSLHQASQSHRDNLDLKSMNVFTASWSSKKPFKVSHLFDYTWTWCFSFNLLPWMRHNYSDFPPAEYHSHNLKQNKSNKWNRKVCSRGSSRNIFLL